MGWAYNVDVSELLRPRWGNTFFFMNLVPCFQRVGRHAQISSNLDIPRCDSTRYPINKGAGGTTSAAPEGIHHCLGRHRPMAAAIGALDFCWGPLKARWVDIVMPPTVGGIAIGAGGGSSNATGAGGGSSVTVRTACEACASETIQL